MIRASVESPAQARHRHVEHAAAVDGAAEHFVADGSLQTGSDSPVIGAWLTWLSPASNAPVERNLLAGSYDHDVADGDRVDRRRMRLGTVAADERLGRRQIHQRTNGAACPFHRARFEHLRQREQEHDRRALGPVAERDRAGNRHHHQHVDIEAARRAATSTRAAPSACRPDTIAAA